MVYNRVFVSLIVFGAMSRSILNISIRYINLKIVPFTTLVKVKIKDTYMYGVILNIKTLSEETTSQKYLYIINALINMNINFDLW